MQIAAPVVPENLITLQPCPKGYTLDQDKACSPEQTVERFHERLRASGLDILKEIRRIDNGRLDIPVYFSVCGAEAWRVIGNKKQMGKGSSPEQSRASACMELAERFSFFSFLKNPSRFLVGDYQEMESLGYPVLPIQTLLASVHDTSHSPQVLREMLAGIPLRWVWARRLSDMSPWLVPFSWFYAINEFNGPAAGNTTEEAVLQGICEVVERHVCAIVSREERQVPEIGLDSITEPVAARLVEKFHTHGIHLHLFDFSLDTGIPTVAALAWDPATFPETSEIVFTAGTTPDANKAVIRAITEVAQLAGDFNSSSNYVASGLPKPGSLGEVAYLLKKEKSETVPLLSLRDLSHADILEEVRACTNALAQQGLEVFVVNTTHADLQIPAVYTIVPGAHFRERAMGGNAVLFAAKLASSLLAGEALQEKLAAMLAFAPDEYSLYFYQGRERYEDGEPEAAIPYLHNALALPCAEEDLPYIYSYLGCCLRDLGRFDEAITALQQGLACDEERADLHNAMGVCLFKLNRYDEAAMHFQRAVMLDPSSAIDYANLALNLEKTGRLDEARRNYATALALDNSIAFASEHLAALEAEQTGEL
ncbi:MAG: tetratricopeptide repeat protein [Desulfobulbaceae bacterium]|nr:tetratricopeptide repeat protein [Desulfobulbaceae bacterium]